MPATPQRAVPERDARFARLTPWLVLAAALLLTAAAAGFVAWGARERDAARFENAVEGAQDRIQGRLEVYLATLRGVAALFAAADTVTAEEFARYAARIDVQRRYPGIQGIGWTERLEAGRPGEADERHAIRFLEPQDARNRAAIGFDMYSEPVRREAMRRARDEGEPALSGRVTLVQEIFGDPQPGFLLYVPVYAGTAAPEGVEARRAALRGFVYAPFRADDLFEGIFGSEEEPRVSFRVYDGPGEDPARLLHASPRAGDPEGADHRAARALRVAGRPWTATYASEPSFDAASRRSLLPSVLLAGLLASGVLFALARGQARARLAAEEANRAKSDFLSTMSHELRTPLNAIAGYVDLLEMGLRGELNEAQRRDLLRIKLAQRHLLALINDVLYYARLEAGTLNVEREPVEMGPLVAEIGEMVAPQMRAKSQAYRVAGEPATVRALGDADRIRQVLLNLLANAVKFTPAGGKIEVRARRADGWAVVEVVDDGPGIAPEKLEAVFEPFVQLGRWRVADGEQGVGLGLAISRRLAEAMGGDLAAESRPGEGSLFRLRLPEADGDGAGPPA